MSTEYKIVTYGCEQRHQAAKALTNWSENGWERVDSWRFTGMGVESVAFLLAKPKEKEKEEELGPPPEPKVEKRACAACGGWGYHNVPRGWGGQP